MSFKVVLVKALKHLLLEVKHYIAVLKHLQFLLPADTNAFGIVHQVKVKIGQRSVNKVTDSERETFGHKARV